VSGRETLSGSARSGMTRFLYFSAQTFSDLHTECSCTLSLLMTNSRPWQVWMASGKASYARGQMRRASLATISSLARCTAGVTGLATGTDANPHCVLSASSSSGL